MATLQSQEFAGDPMLEACAVSDPAHVVPGAVGSHVGKIQNALMKVDSALIDGVELAQQRYGPSTTQAVVNFKSRHKILNYAGKIDNIVGKKTIRALDNGLQGKPIAPGAPPPGKAPKPKAPKESPPVPELKDIPAPTELPAIMIMANGDVQVHVPGNKQWMQGFAGMPLRRNTTVKTGDDGNAIITFPDTTRIIMPPRSLVVIYGRSNTWNKTPPKVIISDPEALLRGLEALSKGQLP